MLAFPNTTNDDDHRISMTSSSISMANVKRPTVVVDYGNIGWLDALHGTSRMYFDMQKQAELARYSAQAAWEAKRDRILKGGAEAR